MKFWKKALAFLMSAIAFFSMVACGGKKGELEKQTYYGTTIEFYVAPKDPKESDGNDYVSFSGYPRIVMENMVALLQADEFTELLFVPQVPTEVGKGLTEEKMEEAEKVMAVYKASVTYSYQNSKDDVDGSLVRSFIYAEIAVLKDGEESREQAEFIRGQLLDVLPLFVEQNMPLMGGYNGTLCKKITRTDEIVEFRK